MGIQKHPAVVPSLIFLSTYSLILLHFRKHPKDKSGMILYDKGKSLHWNEVREETYGFKPESSWFYVWWLLISHHIWKRGHKLRLAWVFSIWALGNEELMMSFPCSIEDTLYFISVDWYGARCLILRFLWVMLSNLKSSQRR